jgi:hypothetical protein
MPRPRTLRRSIRHAQGRTWIAAVWATLWAPRVSVGTGVPIRVGDLHEMADVSNDVESWDPLGRRLGGGNRCQRIRAFRAARSRCNPETGAGHSGDSSGRARGNSIPFRAGHLSRANDPSEKPAGVLSPKVLVGAAERGVKEHLLRPGQARPHVLGKLVQQVLRRLGARGPATQPPRRRGRADPAAIGDKGGVLATGLRGRGCRRRLDVGQDRGSPRVTSSDPLPHSVASAPPGGRSARTRTLLKADICRLPVIRLNG